jgi:hypothetical protein
MKPKNILPLALACVLTFTVAFAQEPIPTSPAQVPSPASGVLMHLEYAKAIGRVAYIWGWPLVNQMNRRPAITEAP